MSLHSLQIAGERVGSSRAAGILSASSTAPYRPSDECSSAASQRPGRISVDLKNIAASIRVLAADGRLTAGVVSGVQPPAASVGGETVLNFLDLVERHPSLNDTPSAVDDPVVIRLTEALAAAERDSSEFAGLYADAIRLITVVRMLSMQPTAAAVECRPPAGGAVLPKWRLKLVADYVSEHLAAKVTLADMAAAARLSRMHFAALFLRATGLRPHEYLLRRRISAARELLQTTDLPIVQIAIEVGFQTQAHFTTVFKKLTGDTPAKLREARRSRA